MSEREYYGIGIQANLTGMHSYLMSVKFPYHSVSVIHRGQDLGFHCIFDEAEKWRVTPEVIREMELRYFTHSFVNIKP